MPEKPDVRLSVSIGGVSRVRPLEEAIRQADHLMYSDKARLCAPPPADSPPAPAETAAPPPG